MAILFTALIIVPHILTFPGAFAPSGLLRAGSQSAAWLYIFWHFGFSGAVVGYVFLRDTKVADGPSVSRAIFCTVMITVSLVCVLTWSVTGDTQLMPSLFRDEDKLCPDSHLRHWSEPTLGRACPCFAVEARTFDT